MSGHFTLRKTAIPLEGSTWEERIGAFLVSTIRDDVQGQTGLILLGNCFHNGIF